MSRNPVFTKIKIKKGNSQSPRYLAWRVRRVLIDVQTNITEWAKVCGAYREHTQFSMNHRVVVVIGYGHSWGFGEYIDAVEMGSMVSGPGEFIQWHREEFESRFRRLDPQPKDWNEAFHRWRD